MPDMEHVAGKYLDDIEEIEPLLEDGIGRRGKHSDWPGRPPSKNPDYFEDTCSDPAHPNPSAPDVEAAKSAWECKQTEQPAAPFRADIQKSKVSRIFPDGLTRGSDSAGGLASFSSFSSYVSVQELVDTYYKVCLWRMSFFNAVHLI